MGDVEKSQAKCNKEQEDEHLQGDKDIIEERRFFQPEIVDDNEYETDDDRYDFYRHCRDQTGKIMGKPQRDGGPDKNVGKDPDPSGNIPGKR